MRKTTKRLVKENQLKKALLTALTHLENSNSQLTRKRARFEFRTVVAKVLNAHPLLNKEGKTVEKKSVVAMCPLCRVSIPFMSWFGMINHLHAKHDIKYRWTQRYQKNRRGVAVPLVKCFGCNKECMNLRGLGKHLNSIYLKNEFESHVVKAAYPVTFGQTVPSKTTQTKTATQQKGSNP